MKIGIVGYGTVGSALGRLMARGPHEIAIYDRFLPSLGSTAHRAAVNNCDLVFVCVPTPAVSGTGACDVSAVEECAAWIEVPICIRSTVTPGTVDRLTAATGKRIGFSPEYIGEGAGHPWKEADAYDFLITGGPEALNELVISSYQSVTSRSFRAFRTTALTAELCKYMENCFLATKVAFVNQFFDIAAAFGVNFDELRELWLCDPRIGASHTLVTPERGFGGRCLPKDISAMVAAMHARGGAPLLEAVLAYNGQIRKEGPAAGGNGEPPVREIIAGDEKLRGLWNATCENGSDAAHDAAHLLRVAEWTLRICDDGVETAEAVAAAMLHDLVNVPKNSDLRSEASGMSALAAEPALAEAGFDAPARARISAAIRDHSFSRGATPVDVLGRALQDADRLDALGAIGLLRAVATGERMGGALFDPSDPWAERRPLDDRAYTVDHFFTKLLRLPNLMNTSAGRTEANRRVAFLRGFLRQLEAEIGRPMPETERSNGASG